MKQNIKSTEIKIHEKDAQNVRRHTKQVKEANDGTLIYIHILLFIVFQFWNVTYKLIDTGFYFRLIEIDFQGNLKADFQIM